MQLKQLTARSFGCGFNGVASVVSEIVLLISFVVFVTSGDADVVVVSVVGAVISVVILFTLGGAVFLLIADCLMPAFKKFM